MPQPVSMNTPPMSSHASLDSDAQSDVPLAVRFSPAIVVVATNPTDTETISTIAQPGSETRDHGTAGGSMAEEGDRTSTGKEGGRQGKLQELGNGLVLLCKN